MRLYLCQKKETTSFRIFFNCLIRVSHRIENNRRDRARERERREKINQLDLFLKLLFFKRIFSKFIIFVLFQFKNNQKLTK